MNLWPLLLVPVFCSVLLGCSSSSAHDDFAEIKAGMDKAQVLEVMGSPRQNTRRDGRDEWNYVFCEGGRRQSGHVVFEKGEVVEVSGPYPLQLTEKLKEAASTTEYEQALQKDRQLRGRKELDCQ
jgi:outer membrane protein assembly factor BamE (lipoprotein component of BamABCDE complex)